ncbi:iron hydrogenase 1 [Clostridium homopropionicum DSM 5847]|uniref:Iron hydrogenase 1 n=1 Tax=Clostridium homopropionicum DSM 5847 TaxID=1121318 RepID=A0A0L6Z755_9CLOT|nr:[Fe-Fe] hydrogenase large subunit C-terminal domain-containing protein [Clostridium homopropionicum]KOA18792.1 iron hydrogenase 1 [Clostridium homopropionicum DSM 5847]SFG77084.1 ferredoxin hydrogenase [Clostridium homopropionicum]
MNPKYGKLFKSLVRSYYNNNFDETILSIMNDESIDKDSLGKTISLLCGVTVNYDDNFLENLKKAIRNYELTHKIVHKIRNCSMDCLDEEGKTICQKSCPFDAILIDQNTNSSYISLDKCTDCGFCVDGCPTGSILDRVEFIPLIDILNKESIVIAAVAPSIIGQFGENVTIDQLRAAFKQLGFTDMVEVAFFADMLTIKEAVEFDHLVNKTNDFMITSCCCPMWIAMLKKQFEELLPHVSPSISPMIAAGKILKELNPDCKVVFIGPCIAKKSEAKEKDLVGIIDYVLTFQELKDIFDVFDIDPSLLENDLATEYASREGRLYGRTGGVSIAIHEAIKNLFPEKAKLVKVIQGNGVKECREILTKTKDRQLDANFIEGMGCVGGCVGGPKAIIPKEKGREILDRFADDSEVSISLNNEWMENILKKLSLDSTDDFNNKEKTKIFNREF